MTAAERVVWRILHQGELRALNFRRQAPFGPYVLDFVSHPARLVVEIDGVHHAEAKQMRHDQRRTTYLKARGYQVVRIWNHHALHNSDGVWLAVYAAARKTIARARMQRWAAQNKAPSSPSMGEAAPRGAGGGAPATMKKRPPEARPPTSRASPPQSALRADSSPVEGEQGATSCERA